MHHTVLLKRAPRRSHDCVNLKRLSESLPRLRAVFLQAALSQLTRLENEAINHVQEILLT